jgi:hypothetical protein
MPESTIDVSNAGATLRKILPLLHRTLAVRP